MATAAAQKVGKVVQVIGPVVDLEFESGHLPEIYNAVHIKSDGKGGQTIDVIVEVEQHLGENRVRTVAMKPTDGMQRGMDAVDTGAPISMPVGPATLGRVMNVLGEPVDFPDRPVLSKERWSIHRKAPTLEQQSTELQMFETGIKVIDLLEPLRARRKDWTLRRRGRRQDGHHPGTDSQRRHEARRRVGVCRRR